MILDTQTKLSDAQALTVTAISNNVLDLRNSASPALVDEGLESGVWLILLVTTTFTAAGAATLTASLVSDSVVGLAASPTVHFTTAAIPVAQMVAGATLARVQLPSGDYERYLGMSYTVGTGPFTAGVLSAFLVLDPQRNVTYPGGFTVA